MKVINVIVNRDNFFNKLKFASGRDWSKDCHVKTLLFE